MGNYMKGAITILVLSIPNFILGQAVESAPIKVENLELAPMEFSWYRDCKSEIAWQDREDTNNEIVFRIVRISRTPLACVAQPSTQLHHLNRYDNGLPATAMLSSEIFFREY